MAPLGSDLVEDDLHHGDVLPAPELASHLSLHADLDEAVLGVQGNAGLVPASDAGDYRVEAAGPGHGQEVAEEAVGHAPAPVVGVHVHRVLHRAAVGGPLLVRGQRSEAQNLPRALVRAVTGGSRIDGHQDAERPRPLG